MVLVKNDVHILNWEKKVSYYCKSRFISKWLTYKPACVQHVFNCIVFYFNVQKLLPFAEVVEHVPGQLKRVGVTEGPSKPAQIESWTSLSHFLLRTKIRHLEWFHRVALKSFRSEHLRFEAFWDNLINNYEIVNEWNGRVLFAK